MEGSALRPDSRARLRLSPALSLAIFLTLGLGSVVTPSTANAARVARADFEPSSALTDEPAENLGYDAIVNELSREAERPAVSLKAKKPHSLSADPFDNVWIHFGVGLSTIMETVSFDNGQRLFLGSRGVQIAGGIDLFSPNWSAEGTYRGFGESEDSDAKVTLQEFELKVFYKNRMSKTLGLRAGGGLSGRYLNVHRPNQSEVQFATPASVVTLGADLYANDNLSLGADLSARNSMISDTIDRTSYDATLRVDTHF